MARDLFYGYSLLARKIGVIDILLWERKSAVLTKCSAGTTTCPECEPFELANDIVQNKEQEAVR